MTELGHLRRPFTESLRSDIVLLSSYLSGRQCLVKSTPEDENLALSVDISTLLALGNNPGQRTKNVNAVIGNHTMIGTEIVVCAEVDDDSGNRSCREEALETSSQRHFPNKRQNHGTRGHEQMIVERDQHCDARGSEEGEIITISPVTENGRKLLDKWDPHRRNDDRVDIPDDLSFEQHLQDFFDILMALNKEPADLLRFQLFMHHRAFRKVGWCVQQFSTHWGKLPFDILSENLDTELKTKIFQFKYRDQHFHKLIQSYVPPEPDKPCRGSNSGPVYSVGAKNSQKWISALKQLWRRLHSYLFVLENVEVTPAELTVTSESPTTQTVNDLVTMMFVLEALLPVFKHLISSPHVALALAKAEYHEGQKSMTHNDFFRQDRIDANMDQHSALFSTKDHYLRQPQKSAERLSLAMEAVLAWQTSCRHMFRKAGLLQSRDNKWRLCQFRYCKQTVKPWEFKVDTVLHLLRAWQGPCDNPSGIREAERIISQTVDAKVHAESALMQWIASVKDVDSSQNWPIGVSKKSCQMCWLLQHIYNRNRLSKFVLSGTHGTFSPWLPPPGLPDAILLELREALLSACRTFASPSTTNAARTIRLPGDLDTSNFHLSGFVRLRGPEAL